MTEYIKIGKVSDFKDVSIRSYAILGKKIGVIKNGDGSFFATEISCKHQGADLTAGTIKDNIATCYRHGWRYNLVTGECLNHESPPLRKYSLIIDGDDIKVSLHPIPDEQ